VRGRFGSGSKHLVLGMGFWVSEGSFGHKVKALGLGMVFFGWVRGRFVSGSGELCA
jgi:hypothetical protein